MNFFKKLFNIDHEEEGEVPEMMTDARRQQNDFIQRIGKIVPVIKQGTGVVDKALMQEGRQKPIPDESLPVLYPVDFDTDLSMIFGIDEGTHYEWLQNKHIEIAKGRLTADDLVNKAYENLLQQLNDRISISMVSEYIGILSNCNTLESSLIFVNSVWAYIQRKVKGDEIVFGIPTQDVFIFTNAERQEEIEVLRDKVHELFDNPKFQKKISRKLYLRKRDGTIAICQN